MDVLLLNQLRIKTRQDSILSKILERILRTIWSNGLMAEKPFKEVRHKLTIEKGIIHNEDKSTSINPKDFLKRVCDDVYYGVMAT